MTTVITEPYNEGSPAIPPTLHQNEIVYPQDSASFDSGPVSPKKLSKKLIALLISTVSAVLFLLAGELYSWIRERASKHSTPAPS
jgi:hypothetical protein